mgnify:CR=1 FL=1
MTHREARREALYSCAALIKVNAELGEGDLWGDLEREPDNVKERYALECQKIANGLIRQALRLA